MRVMERLIFDAASDKVRIRKSDGFMVAEPRVARTGIQIYKGSEMGRDDLDEVRVYRPETEVFAKGAFGSLAHRPITLDHPPEMVDATNWKKYAIGQTGDEVVRDGNMIRIPLMLCDAAAIKAVQNGKRQLSVGYSCELKWESGNTPTGESYDAIQTGILANHLAVVDAARGGDLLSIGDDDIGEDNMQFRTITVDGIDCQITDTHAPIVQRHIKKLEDSVAELTTKLAETTTKATKDNETAVATHTTAIANKDAEITELKKKLDAAAVTPEKLDAMVTERGKTLEKALGILGDGYDPKNKTDAQIRKDAVASRVGDACKNWNDDMIVASFATLEAVGGDDGGGDQRSGFGDMVAGFARQSSRVNNARDKAYDAYVKNLNTPPWQKKSA